MTPEARQFRATDAKQLLENPLFVEAFGKVEDYLRLSALGCDPDDAGKAQRIVITQQLLQAVKREITRVVQDGNVAQIELNEIEKKKRFRMIPTFQR